MRNFDTGATRDSDTNKYDFEAFLSPSVMEAYAAYMHSHRRQADGTLRDGDNWQKGIPKSAYMKSAWRHFFDVWKEHRGIKTEYGLVESLCALLFNIMGYLHETLREQSVRSYSTEYSVTWDTADEDAIYTHRYGALAHDASAIEDDENQESINAEDPRHKSPLPRKYDYTEQDPAFPRLVRENPSYRSGFVDAALRSLSSMEHGQVLGVSPVGPAREMDKVAPKVRDSGFPQTYLPRDGE